MTQSNVVQFIKATEVWIEGLTYRAGDSGSADKDAPPADVDEAMRRIVLIAKLAVYNLTTEEEQCARSEHDVANPPDPTGCLYCYPMFRGASSATLLMHDQETLCLLHPLPCTRLSSHSFLSDVLSSIASLQIRLFDLRTNDILICNPSCRQVCKNAQLQSATAYSMSSTQED